MGVLASREVLAAASNWLEAFVLLAAAHTAAWASGYLLRNRLAAPIDGGLKLTDGHRLLGDHNPGGQNCGNTGGHETDHAP